MREQGQNLNYHSLGDVDVGEPHFNDERTLLTARAVVPLSPFMRFFTRQRLALAGAFVVAALLGAGSALAIIHLRQPSQINVTEAANSEEVNPVAESQPANEQVDETTPIEEDSLQSETAIVPPRRTARRARRAPDTTTSLPKVTIAIKGNDSQPRLVDEWQERRQRRVARPEPRNNHHQRDLFRIREIFEGPRPRR